MQGRRELVPQTSQDNPAYSAQDSIAVLLSSCIENFLWGFGHCFRRASELQHDVLESVFCWEPGYLDLTKRTSFVALDRWLSLSEPWSLHLKMWALIYLRTFYPFCGVVDSVEDLVKSLDPISKLCTLRCITSTGSQIPSGKLPA